MRRFSAHRASCFLACWVALVLTGGLVARKFLQTQYSAHPAMALTLQQVALHFFVHFGLIQGRSTCLVRQQVQSGSASVVDIPFFVAQASRQRTVAGEFADVQPEHTTAQSERVFRRGHNQRKRPRNAAEPPGITLAAPPNVPEVWDVLEVCSRMLQVLTIAF